MTVEEQIEFARKIVGTWPLWKQNILNYSLQPQRKRYVVPASKRKDSASK